MKYIILLFLFSGCASYQLKQRCEATNWFNYSQDVAFNGKYLEEDGFIKDCKGVDRTNSQQLDLGFKLGRDKMCTYDEIYTRGKSGEPVYFDFCDGLSRGQMRARHDEGLKIFCTEPSGLSYGKSGVVYKKVCPISSEPAFMKGYRPGRTEFLTLLIKTNNAQIAQLESQYSDLIRRESRANHEYNLIPNGHVCSNRMVYDEAAKKDVSRYICVVDSALTAQRDNVIRQLGIVRSEMHDTRSKIGKLQVEIKNSEQELLTLK